MTFNTALYRVRLWPDPNLGAMNWTELKRYKQTVDRQLEEAERAKSYLDGLDEGTGKKKWTARGLAIASLAALAGGFSATFDGGALAWYLASGGIAQIGVTMEVERSADLSEINDWFQILADNVEILSSESDGIAARHQRLLGR